MRFGIKVLVSFLLLAAISANAGTTSTLAIVAPESNKTSKATALRLERVLSDHFAIIDPDLTRAAFDAQEYSTPYNLTLREAVILGSSIGSKAFVLVKSDTILRRSFERPEYFESYAAIYLVDSAEGDLLDWNLIVHEDEDRTTAREKMTAKLSTIGEWARDTIERWNKKQNPLLRLPDDYNPFTEEDSRAPLPYRRMKPAYTPFADKYGVAATVDILVEIGADGAVSNSRITRWAGFGLDESVSKTIRKMIWRPADNRKGSFTSKILLRYNFRDIEDSKR